MLAKNLRNQRKHDRISFELAALVFEDAHCLVYSDRIDCKTEEQRWHAIGAAQIETGARTALLVVHAYKRGPLWRRNHPHHLSPRLTSEQLAGMIRLRDARPRKVAVSVRLDARVLAWLRSKGRGHLTRVNDILTNLMEAEEGTRPDG